MPAVRGREISRPVADLVEEVRQLAADGVVDVTLLGQNVNSFGRDLTRTDRRHGGTDRVRPLFADLLREVGAVDGIRRVRFTSPHPKDLRPDTIAAMAETPAVCEHLHLPLQSGSDRVLAAMHRGYTAQRYLDRLAAARAAIPDLAVTTDIIVGFPGETDADFASTLEVAAEAGLRQRIHLRVLASERNRSGRHEPRSSSLPTSSPSASSACGWSSSDPLWLVIGPGSDAPRRPSSKARPARIRRLSPVALARTSSSTSARTTRCGPARSWI